MFSGHLSCLNVTWWRLLYTSCGCLYINSRDMFNWYSKDVPYRNFEDFQLTSLERPYWKVLRMLFRHRQDAGRRYFLVLRIRSNGDILTMLVWCLPWCYVQYHIGTCIGLQDVFGKTFCCMDGFSLKKGILASCIQRLYLTFR